MLHDKKSTGNRTRVTETVSGVTRVITYTYDGLYRLTEADYSTGENYPYVYDAVGNREVMTNATGIYTYTYRCNNLSRGKSCAMIKTRGGQGQSA